MVDPLAEVNQARVEVLAGADTDGGIAAPDASLRDTLKRWEL